MKLHGLRQRKKEIRVAIGPIFDEFGGVSGHIHCVKKYSRCDINEIPSIYTRNVLRLLDLSQGLAPLTPKDIYQEIKARLGLNDFDVLHSHAHAWFTRLCESQRQNASGWIHTYHTLYYFEEDYANCLNEEQKGANKILLDVAPKADIRISVSEWLHEYLLSKYSIDTIVIPNGVDVSECDFADKDRFVKRHSLENFILFIGNMLPIKNPMSFIELAKRMPDKKFVMIGRNVEHEFVERQFGITIPRNIVMLGELSHRDSLDAIASCKVLVMTSMREGLPTTLLEAMALSKPVVAPAHTGCKEVVGSGDCGFLYAPNSINDLFDKTHLALTSEGIGEKARERVLSKYDWRLLAPKIDDIYESLM